MSSEAWEAIAPFDADPPRLLADANFNEHVVRGLRRIRPEISILTAHQAKVDTLADPDLLAYAAKQDLILLTHDTRTMPQHFADFLIQLSPEEYSPGVWYTPQTLAVGIAIRAILEVWLCSAHIEHRNRELRLPL